MLDHRQGAAGVAVDDHGHVAVPLAHRGLIDQKHPAPTAATVLGQRRGPGLDHAVDEVPAQAMAPCRRPQRHDPRVRDEPARQTPRQLVLELGMVLEMARRAVVAHEPAPQPHQRRAPPRHLQIAHLAPAGVVHPGAAEPARRASRPPHGRLDLHPQLARRVRHHREHACLTQVQPHPHRIRSHRGPPGSLIISITDSSRASTPTQGPSTTPLPTFPRRLDNIEGWGSAPVRMVEILRHPTYISHYLYALTAAASEYELPVGDILDVIKLVRTRPWPVEPLADAHRDDSTDWRETKQATVRLIKTLADSNRGFGDQADDAWAVLVSEASDRSEPSDLISNSAGPDLLTSAINRPCTRALEAVLSFLAYEYRSSEAVRSEATALFEEGLLLPGTDGAEHRAVLASRIGFLLHVLPGWTKANRDLLFGSQAPEGLGQLTVEQAIEWSRPNPWLLENFREAVRNAVRSDAEHAMEHMIIAMLWECPGYSIQDTIAFLRTSPDLVSQSGHVLGYVLNDTDADPRLVEIAVDFWKTILNTETGAAVEGFGFLSEVAAMDTEVWEELTLQTIKAAEGRVEWSHGVAERLAASHPTPEGLAILNELVRGRLEEWDRFNVAEKAAGVLSTANDLQDTDAYKRLRTTLLERRVIGE